MLDDKITSRQFTREFKFEAVELLLNGDRKGAELARNLGIYSLK